MILAFHSWIGPGLNHPWVLLPILLLTAIILLTESVYYPTRDSNVNRKFEGYVAPIAYLLIFLFHAPSQD